MAGFIRRYPFYPGTEVVTQIEGVVIIDQTPPGRIEGEDSGVVCVIGEFADMTYAVKVSATGVVETDPRPVEVYSSQDLLDKVGGFDEYLGEFGGSMGNGFVEIRNKRFSRLIVQPVDLLVPSSATTQGTVRVWRELPTNQSSTVPQPIVPVSAAVVLAGREFRNGTDRFRLASRVVFSDAVAFVSGTDGSVTAAGAPAATQTFTSATGDFIDNEVEEGDILVVGVIDGAGGLGANADTYRIVAVGSATSLTVQKMDGSTFDWTTVGSLPYRIHPRATADSSPEAHQLSEAGGYNVLCRPLDATGPVTTELAPTVAPAAGTATTWDVLSGLTAKIHPSTAITYDAALHAPNAAAGAEIDSVYQAAFDALLSDDYPARDIKIVVAARKSATIRSKMKSHVLVASERGLTRRGVVSPPIDELTLSTVLGDASPGVGATRDERIDYSWPGTQTSIPEAVGYSIATSDGKTTTDGILDVTCDTVLASVESVLPPERNPGQAQPPVPAAMAMFTAFARGTPRLGMPEYIQLRSQGIAALRFDKVAGAIFQSGVTTSLTSGQKNINRRRMADFIQDSISSRLVMYSKLPLTRRVKDDAVSEVDSFLLELLSPDNPDAQRINDYSVDDKSGNTPASEAANIHVIITRVRLTPTGDFIVLQTDIGEGVVITRAL